MGIFFGKSVQSINSKLKYFYYLVAFVASITVFIAFFYLTNWTESHTGKHLIGLDANVARQRYQSGEQGILNINMLTTAYNSLNLLPQTYREALEDKEYFLGELTNEKNSKELIYLTQYSKNGENKPLILVSDFSKIKLNTHEFVDMFSIVISVFIMLLFLFVFILNRLSKKVLAPINNLSEQLKKSKGDVNLVFEIDVDAAKEFTELTAQLNSYRTEIASLLKREQLFARSASHELRTPLSIIKGANTLLLESKNNDFQNRQLQKIKKSSEQMINIISALLSLVRYERNKGEIDLRVLTKNELENIIEDYVPYLKKRENTIELLVYSEPFICADVAVIRMVFGNLLHNAISATENGEIKIYLEAQNLKIVDTGNGISGENFSDGHGLGLQLIESICTRYAWKFSLENRIEKGCIATIQFK